MASADGRCALYLLPSANTEWMGLAPEEFARWADPEGRKVLVLLLDGAGWHVAERLAVPANVVLRPLPPCTPELQPVEPLWPLLREAVANRGPDELEAMQAPLCDRCCWMMSSPEAVRGAVGFGRAALESA
jgi:transposase